MTEAKRKQTEQFVS